MIKKVSALILASSFFASASSNVAAQPSEGDMSLFLSNTFSESNLAFDLLGLPAGPVYNIGYFLNDDLMAYGSLRIINHEEGTNLGLGLGARFYQAGSGQLRTFIDGSFSYATVEVAGIGDLGLDDDDGSTDISIMSLGGFFGAEYMFSPNFSVAAKVGATFTDYGKDADATTLDLGAVDIMFNFYF